MVKSNFLEMEKQARIHDAHDVFQPTLAMFIARARGKISPVRGRFNSFIVVGNSSEGLYMLLDVGVTSGMPLKEIESLIELGQELEIARL